MFARVITAQASHDGVRNLIRSAENELPAARQRPGFAGYLLLNDESTGKVLVISLWQTREDMMAVGRDTAEGIHDEAVPATGVGQLQLETFEVPVHA